MIKRRAKEQDEILERVDRAVAEMRFDLALLRCTKGLRSKPGDRELLTRKAEICNLLNKPKEARKVYEELLRSSDDEPKLRFGLALCYFFERKNRDAEREVRKLISAHPRYLKAQVLLADICYRRGDHDESLKITSEAISQRGKDIENEDLSGLYYVQAKVLLKKGDKSAARISAVRAVELNKANLACLSLLRRVNPECNASTRLLYLEVEGDAPFAAFHFGNRVVYHACFEVLADGQDEALSYIKEIETIAIVEGLRVTYCKKLNLKGPPSRFQKGVVVCYPSLTTEEAMPQGKKQGYLN